LQERVSPPVQTSRGAYPTSITIGTGSFLGVKWPACAINNPPPFSTQGKGAEQYLYFLSAPTCPYLYLYYHLRYSL